MKHVLFGVVAFGFATAVAVPARADDAKEARALVDKAIKAHGGAEAVAKYQAAVGTFKGTFHGMGMEVPMTGEISTFGGDKIKVDVQIEAGGMKIPVVSVLNGDKGWLKVGDTVTELDKDQLAEGVEKAHAGWVASLAPLVTGKGYTLATTGELLVGEKKALGVKVTTKGRRDVELYFDKETGLLARYDVKVKDEGTGQEVTEETVMSEYKDVKGVKQAAKFTTKRDGKLHVEGEVSDHQLSEKLEASVFDKP
jgi:hypothetical protein